jgi:hypothetical protein
MGNHRRSGECGSIGDELRAAEVVLEGWAEQMGIPTGVARRRVV